jgi:hypothetical protein
VAFGRHPGIALRYLPLDVGGAAQCIDYTAELDQETIAGGFDETAVVLSDF